jgi:hypothetical protein
LIGPSILLITAMATATVARHDFARWRSASPACIAAAAALAAFCLVIAIASVRPILVDRYLTAFVPGILLGVSMIACRAATRNWLAPAGLALILAINFSIWLLAPYRLDTRYNFQVASDFLALSQVKHVTFYWDHPVLPIEDRSQLKRVSSFFFNRAHEPIDVEPAFIDRMADPNPILAHDLAKPGTGLIWMYNTSVPGTTAARFSPRLPMYNPAILCRKYGFGVLACINPSAAHESVEAPAASVGSSAQAETYFAGP